MSVLENPTKCLWHLEPDRRFNFFKPLAHIRAVLRVYVRAITEITLHVTLNNKSH